MLVLVLQLRRGKRTRKDAEVAKSSVRHQQAAASGGLGGLGPGPTPLLLVPHLLRWTRLEQRNC